MMKNNSLTVKLLSSSGSDVSSGNSSEDDTEDPNKTSPGARMLKKARSFKDELKDRITHHIKRSPTHSGAHSGHTSHSPSPSPSKSPKTALKKNRAVHRAGSFNEGTRTEKKAALDDVDRLQQESKKVFNALKYIQDVVDKNSLTMLSGSASIVLETVMEVSNLLNSLFINRESSVLVSRYDRVNQSLADLIKWSDDILLQGDKALDKESASQVIKALHDAIKDLIQLCIDKLQNKTYQTLPPKSPSSKSASSLPDCPKRASLPDIPLTPREMKILQETSIYNYDDVGPNNGKDTSVNNNGIYDNHDFSEAPPPKPPLPPSFYKKKSPIRDLDSVDSAGSVGDAPPPLPSKRRSHPMEMFTSGQLTTTDQSPHSSLDLSSHMMAGSQSPFSMTPLSTSPSSSVCSSLNQSREDLLGERSTSLSFGAIDSRFSHYDNTLNLATCKKGDHTAEINQLTYKINQLTSSISLTPPPLPSKRSPRHNRLLSTYDNVTEMQAFHKAVAKQTIHGSCSTSGFSSAAGFSMMKSSQSASFQQSGVSYQAQMQSQLQQRTMYAKATISKETFSSSSSETFSSSGFSSAESLQFPPPLPPKKKHIQDYMGMLGNYSQPNLMDFTRHSIHSLNFYQAQFRQYQLELFPPYMRSNTISIMSNASSDYSTTSGGSGEEHQAAAPALPPKQVKGGSPERMLTGRMKTSQSLHSEPDMREHYESISLRDDSENRLSAPALTDTSANDDADIQKDGDSDFAELSLLDDVDVTDQLVKKKQGEDGPEIRGGALDALIVHATTAGKNGKKRLEIDFLYQEAFLTTYRTFITSKQLCEKLLYRYNKFATSQETSTKKLSRNAFSLLIRVVDELCCEINEELLQLLMQFVCQLVCNDELMLARILRKKILEKWKLRQLLLQSSSTTILLSSYQLTAKQQYLTEFKSIHVAEQMTLLDADLFQKIEIPEVLLWAKEQSEELSPNLTLFTEHFNKMSYWCRSRILEQDDTKERERYLMKFIKIMKHLRRMNNFNSYLAILSAVDSAPIRRLEWQRQNTEALKEFCQLIDSSSSFRAYRMALAETEPPCIPYIGLILQDLTFVHIGNKDSLRDGHINFAKRWQQFNILDNMRRFKKCNYPCKKSSKILAFFNNFDDHLSEESLWQISESIKPRGGRKKVEQQS